MIRAEQGDILRISGINWPVIVVSNDHFNQIGEAIVCPIMADITPNAVHLPLSVSASGGMTSGTVACEHVRHVDLNARRFAKVASLNLSEFPDISDTLIALFEFR